MSVEPYWGPLVRLRLAFRLLGPWRGRCQLCGACPDARHRQADAITEALLAGDTPELVAADYLPPQMVEEQATVPRGVLTVYEIAVATPAAGSRPRHGKQLTAGRVAAVEPEVWADLLEQQAAAVPERRPAPGPDEGGEAHG